MAKSDNFSPEPTPGDQIRGLARSCDRAVLSTADRGRDGWPHGSLVLVACGQDAAPLLLISDLAEHTKNIDKDPRISLLFDGTVGLDDPLTGARASLLGHAERCENPHARARFLRRHPSAEMYAGFGDFKLFRLRPLAAHIVAGFGKIHWVDAPDIFRPAAPELAEREADIIEHMNQDHADAIQLYANNLLGLAGADWQMTGCDAEGCDLRRGGQIGRLAFDHPIETADQARSELVRLAKRARQIAR